MDILTHPSFEIVTHIDREPSTEELIGRRIFIQIAKQCTTAYTVGEVKNWTNYSIQFPKTIKLSFANFSSVASIKYKYLNLQNTLTIEVIEPASALDSRNFTQHIINEVKKCQKKTK